MNETLITALVQQAANEMDKVPAGNPAYEELAKLLVKQDNRVLTAFRRKLVELTVKECARVDSEENNPDHVDGETYNQTILQHFGVEE